MGMIALSERYEIRLDAVTSISHMLDPNYKGDVAIVHLGNDALHVRPDELETLKKALAYRENRGIYCETCEGRGEVRGYNPITRTGETQPCARCNGTGSLLMRT